MGEPSPHSWSAGADEWVFRDLASAPSQMRLGGEPVPTDGRPTEPSEAG